MSRVLLPTLLAAVLLAGGCGDADEPRSAVEPHRHRQHDATATPAPTTSPSPSGQAGSDTRVSSGRPHRQAHHRQAHEGRHKVGRLGGPMARPDGAWGHLLDADRMPAPVDAVAWSVASTAPEGGEPTGACQKTSLVDLGAVRAVRRDFAGPEDSTFRARQVVARFADPKSAWRAGQVLRSWRDDCAERLDYPRSDVGPLEEVATEPGSGGRYPLTYGSRRSLESAELGIVRKGRWLTVVEIEADHEAYAADRSPARRAVRKIAATFG